MILIQEMKHLGAYFISNFYRKKMNRISLVLFMLATVASIHIKAQSISINNDGLLPDSSAILDISSSEKGVLIPRMTASERISIVSPANGLMVFQTNNPVGIYIYFDQFGSWSRITPDSSLSIGSVLELGRNAKGDTMLNLGAMTIGANKRPNASVQIDSFLVIQGKPFSDTRWFGSNIKVESSNVRYINNGTVGVFAFGNDQTLIAHWDYGLAGSALNSSASSEIDLKSDRIRLAGANTDFKIELQGIVEADSFRIVGGSSSYALPNEDGSAGQLLYTDGSGVLRWSDVLSDNLGDHQAIQNIKLGSFYLSGDGDDEGIHVAANGNVTIGNNTGFEQFAIWNSTADAAATLNSEVASSVITLHSRGNSGTNQITAFRSRGSSSTQTSVQAGDEIFRINVQPFNGSFSSSSEAVKIAVDDVSSGIISTRIGLFTRDLSGSNIERLRILGNGDIGIGTTDPSGPLTVSRSVAASSIDGAFVDIQNDIGVTGTMSGVRFKNNIIDGNTRYNAAIYHRVVTPTNYQLNFAVRLNPATASNIDDSDIKMTILDNGNVGIGTTNPSSNLDVVGDLEIDSGGSVGDDAFYFGDPLTDGSWRIKRDGNDLSFERRESGVWTFKMKINP